MSFACRDVTASIGSVLSIGNLPVVSDYTMFHKPSQVQDSFVLPCASAAAAEAGLPCVLAVTEDKLWLPGSGTSRGSSPTKRAPSMSLTVNAFGA